MDSDVGGMRASRSSRLSTYVPIVDFCRTGTMDSIPTIKALYKYISRY